MSIYAKSIMETMPGSCAECKFGERYGFVGEVKCRVLDEYFTGNVKPPHKERPDKCPLVEFCLEQDLSEVIRCKDCDFYHSDSCPTCHVDQMTYRDRFAIDDENGFCSYAEKKQE